MKPSIALFASVALGCGSSSAPTSSASGDDDAGGVDAAPSTDGGGSHPDTGVGDASPTDSGTGADSATDGSTDGATSTGAHIAVPMYVDPSTSPTLWTEMYSAGGPVGLLVANADSGPGGSVDSDYTSAITSAHAASEKIIGYVHTSYAARAIADVEADVDAWYSFYPNLDGIFVDEVSTTTSTVESYYAPLYTHIKAKGVSVTVAINPGTMIDESFMTAGDIVVTFEDTYAHFTDPNQHPANPSWVATYPASRFWNLILSTGTADEQAAITGARARNAGWIYVTAEGPATAYQNIETGSYWTTEISDVTAP